MPRGDETLSSNWAALAWVLASASERAWCLMLRVGPVREP